MGLVDTSKAGVVVDTSKVGEGMVDRSKAGVVVDTSKAWGW